MSRNGCPHPRPSRHMPVVTAEVLAPIDGSRTRRPVIDPEMLSGRRALPTSGRHQRIKLGNSLALSRHDADKERLGQKDPSQGAPLCYEGMMVAQDSDLSVSPSAHPCTPSPSSSSLHGLPCEKKRLEEKKQRMCVKTQLRCSTNPPVENGEGSAGLRRPRQLPGCRGHKCDEPGQRLPRGQGEVAPRVLAQPLQCQRRTCCARMQAH
jgi:hypothetical protein